MQICEEFHFHVIYLNTLPPDFTVTEHTGCDPLCLCKHPEDSAIKITRTLFPLFNGAGCTDGCLLFIFIIYNRGDINPFLLEDGVKKH